MPTSSARSVSPRVPLALRTEPAGGDDARRNPKRAKTTLVKAVSAMLRVTVGVRRRRLEHLLPLLSLLRRAVIDGRRSGHGSHKRHGRHAVADHSKPTRDRVEESGLDQGSDDGDVVIRLDCVGIASTGTKSSAGK